VTNEPIEHDNTIVGRPKSSRVRTFLIIGAFTGGFSGYQLMMIGVFVAGLGYASRYFTVPYRAGFLAFALLVILYGISTRSFARLGRLWIPLLIFWLLYFIRIAMDGYLFPVPLGMEPIEHVQKAVGMTFIPMFIFLLRLDSKGNRWVFNAFWTVQIGCLIIILLFYKQYFGETYRLLVHASTGNVTTLMGPIGLAYIGVVTVVISFQRLLMNISFLRSMVLLVIIAGGITIIIFSATLSALVAILLACSIIIISVNILNRYSRKVIWTLLIVLTVCLSSYIILEKIGSAVVTRSDALVTQLASGDPGVGSGRLGIYQNTLKQIFQNPLFGSGLEEKHARVYPHNNILEAFMATGVLGGICFCILCWATLKRCFLVLRKKNNYGWIACIFIVYFIQGLFSSSIINQQFWYSMLAVCAVPITDRQRNITGTKGMYSSNSFSDHSSMALPGSHRKRKFY